MAADILSDLKNLIVGGTSVAPQTISSDTTTTGSAVDMQLSDGPIHAMYHIGNSGDAQTTITISMTECDTSGGSYTAISGATVTLSASATANDYLVGAVPTNLRSKRYVKAVVVTAGGGTPSVPISVAVVGRRKLVGSGTGYVSV